jgi:hypothetical protein
LCYAIADPGEADHRAPIEICLISEDFVRATASDARPDFRHSDDECQVRAGMSADDHLDVFDIASQTDRRPAAVCNHARRCPSRESMLSAIA